MPMGNDPNAMDARGVTAIAQAAGRNDPRGILDLLKAGANPNPPWHPGHPRNADYAVLPAAQNYSFQIPLFAAVEAGDVDCVELLLLSDVKVLDGSQRTALFYARDADVARVLVSAGIDVEHPDRFGWTALTNAACDGDAPRVRALLAVGADPNARHDRGYTVFMSAVGAMERNVEVLKALIEGGADPRAVSELGYNAFHAAIDVNGEANEEDSVRGILTFLTGLGLDIEGRNKRGDTPLMRAIECGTATEVRVLLELGADSQASFPRCADGRSCRHAHGSPLLFGAIGDPDKLQEFLRAGADPVVRNPGGQTPLEYARQLRRDAEHSKSTNLEWQKTWKERLDRSIMLLEPKV